jgi:hypothetical protein
MADYTVLPLSPDDIAWLQSEKLVLPDIAGPSRYPTLNELKHALSLLENFRVQFDSPNPDGPWKVLIDRADGSRADLQTVLSITPYQGEDVPHGFWFEKGWPPLVVALLQRLAMRTGPLVVLAVSDAAPVVIEATGDVAAILKSWRHTAASY